MSHPTEIVLTVGLILPGAGKRDKHKFEAGRQSRDF